MAEQEGGSEARQVREQVLGPVGLEHMAQAHPGAQTATATIRPKTWEKGEEEEHRRGVRGLRLEVGREQFDRVVDLGEEVAVGECAALGAAGGAGVDEGGERVGAEHPAAHGDLLVRDVLAQLGQPLQVSLLEDPHVHQSGIRSRSGPSEDACATVSVARATAPESWRIQRTWKTEEVG